MNQRLDLTPLDAAIADADRVLVELARTSGFDELVETMRRELALDVLPIAEALLAVVDESDQPAVALRHRRLVELFDRSLTRNRRG